MRPQISQRFLMALVVAGLLLGTWASAFAQGLIVDNRQREWPEDMPVPQARNFGISIKSHAIEVTIKDQVATTKVTQIFHNPTPRNLEATYFFPLPEEASINQFSMTMEGKMVEGEVLEANQARTIYEGIVRSQRDPGLLEYVGRKLFRARIFPVTPNGDTTVVMTYTELLNGEAGLVRYQYPLNTSKYTDSVTSEVVVKVNIENQVPLRAVYSPSHDVELIREGDHKAIVGLEAKEVAPNRDFQLYYTIDTSDIGLTLVSFKDAGEDGYFMLIATPKQEYTAEEIQPKDIIFVVDTSGSMSDGNKIAQARNALKYCLQSLNPNDRFNVVPFSTMARKFRDGLVPANADMVTSAVNFADGLRASGGTAINDALTTALGMFDPASTNVPMVVFMTDGLPTIGERNVQNILTNANSAMAGKVRIFTFGVGNDVNTHLLDKLADATRGAREYIAPTEDIETKVGAFYDKVSSPVLANLSLDLGEAGAYDVFPRELPDLFKGSQLVIFGRYRGHGPQAVKLSGVVNGEPREFVYEGTFAQADVRNDFIPRLWALRKVGFMMDEIRLHGYSDELKNEIVRLGTRFGIVTPYTSFLVVTDEEMQRFQQGQPRPVPPGARRGDWGPEDDRNENAARPNRLGATGGGRAPAEPAADPDSALAAPPASEANPSGHANGFNNSSGPGLDAEQMMREARDSSLQSGEQAVERSRQADALKSADSLDELAKDGASHGTQVANRTVGTKTFMFRAGWWIDAAFDPAAHKDETRVKIEAFSAEYFDLLRQVPELARYLALGERVVIVHDGKAFVIQPAAESTEENGEENGSDNGDESGE